LERSILDSSLHCAENAEAMIHWRDEVFRVIGLLLMCMAMFSVAGGHWAVLQAIAWAQMLQDYSRNGPITEAIAKTFSGRSPCSMCTKISEEQQREGRTPAVVKFDKKAEVFLVQALDPLKKPASEDYSYVSPRPSALLKRFRRASCADSHILLIFLRHSEI
jgi:hypothetical protein